MPFKFSIIFQNQFQVESNLTRAKSDFETNFYS